MNGYGYSCTLSFPKLIVYHTYSSTYLVCISTHSEKPVPFSTRSPSAHHLFQCVPDSSCPRCNTTCVDEYAHIYRYDWFRDLFGLLFRPVRSACALRAGRYATVVEQSRKLVNAHQFNNEPLRILLAALGSGLHATDSFLASTLSKHLLREVRLADAAIKNKDALRWNPTLRRYGLPSAPTNKGGENDDAVDDEDEATREGSPTATEKEFVLDKTNLPTKSNPINIALYGQICLAARSYQSALCTSVAVTLTYQCLDLLTDF